MITLDFETYYDREYSLSKMTTEQYLRDARFEVIGVSVKVDEQPATWFSGTKEETAAWLKQFNIEEQYLLAHNTAFDGAILAWHFGIKPRYYLDTLSMARPITGLTVGGSLAALAKMFLLGEKGNEVVSALGKRRKDFLQHELAAYGEYCKNDSELCFSIYRILKGHSTPKELYLIDLMLRMFIDPVLVLDLNVLVDHLASVKARKEAVLEAVRMQLSRQNNISAAGGTLNDLMSNPKLALLLQQYGVDPPTKISPTTGKETWAFSKTDQAFKELLEHENPDVQAIVAARLGVKSTLEETRTEAFIGISQRGALPILLNYYGGHTGRASGGDKTNLQNLPRGGPLRAAILAPDEHLLVAGDSSQIEARGVAWLAGQDDLLEDFRNKIDIYSNFASDIYNRPIDRKKGDKLEGFVGKTCILGLGFGMGKDKFKNTLKVGQGGISVDMPIEECARTVELYRRKYPMIPKLWKAADEALKAMAEGYEYRLGRLELLCNAQGVHLPNGMKLRYPNLRRTTDGYAYDTRKGAMKLYGGKLVENVVQALARIVVFDQMCKADQKIRPMDSPERRWRTVLTVHDEVVLCVPENAAKATAIMLEDIMSTPPLWAPDLPVACEVGVGKAYGLAK